MGFSMSNEKKERWFSVTAPLRINGKKYTPSVCYSLGEDIEIAVIDAAKSGKTILYDHRVRFVSGKAIDVAVAVVPVSVDTVFTSEPVVDASEKETAEKETAEKATQKKTCKKSSREF